ncbi:MAG: PilZ domain-containing protein [Planctomycetota bacterium]|jgi:hypothetical protein
MDGDEKRSHRRKVVRFAVRVTLEGGKVFDGMVENLGKLGALVTTSDLETPLEVGGKLDLEIEMPDGSKVETAGEILRLDQEFSQGEIRRALAVRFAGEWGQ